METAQMAKLAVQAAAAKKAKRMVVMDLRSVSDICEIQVVCSAESERQTKAIADSVEDAFKVKHQMRPVAIEGKSGGQWVLLDYGSVMVHIFFEPIRDYYAIEELWPSAKFLEARDLEA